MRWTRSERLSVWLLRFVPACVAVAPERILINISCVLIGLGAFMPTAKGSLFAHWPHWLVYEWGAAMILGGVITLIGIGRRLVGLERLGLLLIAFCSLYYAGDLAFVFHQRSFPGALIFAGIAGAKFVRLLVSSAARAHIAHTPDRDS